MKIVMFVTGSQKNIIIIIIDQSEGIFDQNWRTTSVYVKDITKQQRVNTS